MRRRAANSADRSPDGVRLPAGGLRAVGLAHLEGVHQSKDACREDRECEDERWVHVRPVEWLGRLARFPHEGRLLSGRGRDDRAGGAPAEGDGGAPVSKQGPLPGGAVLDDRTGLERFYAVCTPSPLAFEVLTKTVRETVRGADDLRKGPALPGLPKGSRQASLLLEKRP